MIVALGISQKNRSAESSGRLFMTFLELLRKRQMKLLRDLLTHGASG
jgi:hypothetical protein